MPGREMSWEGGSRMMVGDVAACTGWGRNGGTKRRSHASRADREDLDGQQDAVFEGGSCLAWRRVLISLGAD
jgi:hypothetical protein